MDYRFPPELQAYVDEMVKKGVFANEHELVLDAVQRQRDLEMNRRRKYDELKTAIQVGIEQSNRGQTAPLDIDSIWQKVLAELKSDARAG